MAINGNTYSVEDKSNLFKDFSSKFISSIGTEGSRGGLRIHEALKLFESDYPGMMEKCQNALDTKAISLIRLLESEGKVTLFNDFRGDCHVVLKKRPENENIMCFIDSAKARSTMNRNTLRSSGHIQLSPAGERRYEQMQRNNHSRFSRSQNNSHRASRVHQIPPLLMPPKPAGNNNNIRHRSASNGPRKAPPANQAPPARVLAPVLQSSVRPGHYILQPCKTASSAQGTANASATSRFATPTGNNRPFVPTSRLYINSIDVIRKESAKAAAVTAQNATNTNNNHSPPRQLSATPSELSLNAAFDSLNIADAVVKLRQESKAATPHCDMDKSVEEALKAGFDDDWKE